MTLLPELNPVNSIASGNLRGNRHGLLLFTRLYRAAFNLADNYYRSNRYREAVLPVAYGSDRSRSGRWPYWTNRQNRHLGSRDDLLHLHRV